jgi:PAS domain S-box-containing protein
MSGTGDTMGVAGGHERMAPGARALRPLSEAGLDDELIWGLVDAAPDGIALADEDGKILLVNTQTEKLFGYDRGELLGRSVDELLPERLRQVHRAHRTRYRAEPRVRSMGVGVPLFGRRQDGTEFPVEVSLSPLHTANGLRVVAAIRDISARAALEAEAREVQEALDATRDGVLIFDAETFRFVYVNDGAVDQVGYTRDELLDMTPMHITPEFTRERLERLVDEIGPEPGASVTLTTMHRRKDGVDIPVEMVIQARRDAEGKPTAYVKVVRDISERLEAETRLRATERDLRLLEDRERIARDLHDNVIQRLFAAGMALQGAVARLGDNEVGDRIGRVVDELDTTIREIRTAIFGLQTTTAASTELRQQVLQVLADERGALGFTPRLAFDGPVDTLAGDVAEHLVATLREALSNIARHAGATDVDIVVQAGEDICLGVTDNGIGIPDDFDAGNGLRNMAERARLLSGSCSVQRGADGGTVLEWRVPAPVR